MIILLLLRYAVPLGIRLVLIVTGLLVDVDVKPAECVDQLLRESQVLAL